MVRPAQNSTEQTTPSISRQIIDEVSTKLAWVVDKTVSAPFKALKAFAEAIAKPVVYGSVALTALHITLRPGQSKEMARKVLYASPKVIENILTSAPGAFNKACELTGRVYHTSFRALGNKVGLAESAQTVPAVLKGLVIKGPELAKKARPEIVKALDSLLTETGKGLTQATDYMQQTAMPWAINQFNTTFPAQQKPPAMQGV